MPDTCHKQPTLRIPLVVRHQLYLRILTAPVDFLHSTPLLPLRGMRDGKPLHTLSLLLKCLSWVPFVHPPQRIRLPMLLTPNTSPIRIRIQPFRIYATPAIPRP